MSKKSNRLKARLRIEENTQQRWLRRYHDERERAEYYKRRWQRLDALLGRLASVEYNDQMRTFVFRHAISEHEVRHLRDDAMRQQIVDLIVNRAYHELLAKEEACS